MPFAAGDVLFVWDKGFVPEMIEKVTHGPSHCAIFVGEDTVAEAQGGRRVGEAPLSFYLSEPGFMEVWRDPTVTADDQKRLVEEAKKMYGTKYDYGIIPIELLHFEWGLPDGWFHEKDRVICSTYLDLVSRRSGKVWNDDENPAPVDTYRYACAGHLERVALFARDVQNGIWVPTFT